jgi:hypothetical protein
MKRIGHLKVNGLRFQPRHSKAEARLKKHLSSLPDDEVMHIFQVCKNGGFGSSTILFSQQSLIRSGMAYRYGAKVYYGNKTAILALKRLLSSGTL